jgi:ABC-2 type transport system ATP-binding protein
LDDFKNRSQTVKIKTAKSNFKIYSEKHMENNEKKPIENLAVNREIDHDKIVIDVDHVTKVFEIPHEKRNTLKSIFMNPFRKIKMEKYKALDDVNFHVKKGEFVGIIGRNGSGKSTMLKLLAQIYDPTSGKIQMNGDAVPFLELGVGFNPELSGKENIFLNGTILGMSKKYLWSKYDEIVAFSEIGDFIDLQTKNYSSGMVIRLAFSIAIQAKAEIYLMDEVLSVGDGAFQKKSLAKMEELLLSGATIVFVSHGMDNIRKYCNRVMVMEHGSKVFDGAVEEGVALYEKMLAI